MTDKLREELDKAHGKIQLQQIIKEGFIDSGKTSGYLQIYEKDNERVFYDGRKDRIACRFDLRDLMTKL